MIRIETLGTVRISRDGEPIDALLRQRLRCAVLLYISVEGETTRELVASVFWPDRASERARHALSQTIYELRRALGDEIIETAGDRVRVNAALTVDVTDFVEAVEREDFTAAVGLYQGPFLHGFRLAEGGAFESWSETKAGQLVRLHRRARRTVIQQMVAAGDIAGAMRVARRWVEIDAEDDEAQHSLIQLLAVSGSRTEALRQYERYERLLEENGLEPLEATLQLTALIRAGRVESWIPIAGSSDSAPRIVHGAGAISDNAAAAVPSDPKAGGTGGPWAAIRPEDDLEERLRVGIGPEMEVIRLLGRGGTTAVYLAREVELRRLVAVKVLRPVVGSDETTRERFAREAYSAGRISHTSVATVHRVGTLPDGIPYIVMEYVDGRTLAATIDATGPLTGASAWTILASIASALAAAHERGVVHRDVRPANVFMEKRTGRTVLADFGIAAILDTGVKPAARITAEGVRLGELGYMSPEQIRGEPVTEQSDVYAFGILAYSALTGSSPYDAAGDTEVVGAHLRQVPKPLANLRPDLDSGRARVIEQCLAKEPKRRPRASEVAALLSGQAELRGGASSLSSFAPSASRARQVSRRLSTTVAWISIVASLLVVLGAIWLWAR